MVTVSGVAVIRFFEIVLLHGRLRTGVPVELVCNTYNGGYTEKFIFLSR
jgi:hypothetical protein